MIRLIHHMDRDDGFTLTEFMVVVSLLGVVLAASWAGMFAIQKADSVTSAQNTAAHDFADPMEWMSKIVMQATSIDYSVSPSAYRLGVWTNRDNDATPELNVFKAESNGKLTWEWWVYDTTRTTYTQHMVFVMSDKNANVANSIPLFTYYNASGAPITDMAQVPSYTYRVTEKLAVTGSNGAPITDTRDIMLRNKR